jgi:hypothetical protein
MGASIQINPLGLPESKKSTARSPISDSKSQINSDIPYPKSFPQQIAEKIS